MRALAAALVLALLQVPVARGKCPVGQFQTSPFVVNCDGTQESVSIDLQGAKQGHQNTLVQLPARTPQVRIFLSAGFDLDLQFMDVQDESCIVGYDCLFKDPCPLDAQGAPSYCIAYQGMSVYFSGDDQTVTVEEAIHIWGETTRVMTLDANAFGPTTGLTALANFSHEPLATCPDDPLPGCNLCEAWPGCLTDWVPSCDGGPDVVCLPPTTTTTTRSTTTSSSTSTTSRTATSTTTSSRTTTTTTTGTTTRTTSSTATRTVSTTTSTTASTTTTKTATTTSTTLTSTTKTATSTTTTSWTGTSTTATRTTTTTSTYTGTTTTRTATSTLTTTRTATSTLSTTSSTKTATSTTATSTTTTSTTTATSTWTGTSTTRTSTTTTTTTTTTATTTSTTATATATSTTTSTRTVTLTTTNTGTSTTWTGTTTTTTSSTRTFTTSSTSGTGTSTTTTTATTSSTTTTRTTTTTTSTSATATLTTTSSTTRTTTTTSTSTCTCGCPGWISGGLLDTCLQDFESEQMLCSQSREELENCTAALAAALAAAPIQVVQQDGDLVAVLYALLVCALLALVALICAVCFGWRKRERRVQSASGKACYAVDEEKMEREMYNISIQEAAVVDMEERIKQTGQRLLQQALSAPLWEDSPQLQAWCEWARTNPALTAEQVLEAARSRLEHQLAHEEVLCAKIDELKEGLAESALETERAARRGAELEASLMASRAAEIREADRQHEAAVAALQTELAGVKAELAAELASAMVAGAELAQLRDLAVNPAELLRMQERLAGITREHDALLLGAQAALEERAQMQARILELEAQLAWTREAGDEAVATATEARDAALRRLVHYQQIAKSVCTGRLVDREEYDRLNAIHLLREADSHPLPPREREFGAPLSERGARTPPPPAGPWAGSPYPMMDQLGTPLPSEPAAPPPMMEPVAGRGRQDVLFSPRSDEETGPRRSRAGPSSAAGYPPEPDGTPWAHRAGYPARRS